MSTVDEHMKVTLSTTLMEQSDRVLFSPSMLAWPLCPLLVPGTEIDKYSLLP